MAGVTHEASGLNELEQLLERDTEALLQTVPPQLGSEAHTLYAAKQSLHFHVDNSEADAVHHYGVSKIYMCHLQEVALSMDGEYWKEVVSDLQVETVPRENSPVTTRKQSAIKREEATLCPPLPRALLMTMSESERDTAMQLLPSSMIWHIT